MINGGNARRRRCDYQCKLVVPVVFSPSAHNYRQIALSLATITRSSPAWPDGILMRWRASALEWPVLHSRSRSKSFRSISRACQGSRGRGNECWRKCSRRAIFIYAQKITALRADSHGGPVDVDADSRSVTPMGTALSKYVAIDRKKAYSPEASNVS